MSLRIAISNWAVAALLLIVVGGGVLLALGTTVSAAPSGSVPTSAVVEKLPWFDSPGVNLSYAIVGSYPSPNSTGTVRYTGTSLATLQGVNAGGRLKLTVRSSVSNPVLPNGTFYDDPFFPSFVPIFPKAFVVPSNFSVIAPGYGLFFVYTGNSTFRLGSTEYKAYVYSGTISTGGGLTGGLPVKKVFEVSVTDGLVFEFNLSNTANGAKASAILNGFSGPSSTTPNSISVTVPDYAKPGSYLEYSTGGGISETLDYTTLFAEPGGAFYFEKTNTLNGKLFGPVFFEDNFTHPLFYPAAFRFTNPVAFGVTLASPQAANLTYLGTAGVQTGMGTINAYAYSNDTVHFEVYLDPATGAAVYLELQNGLIELSSSNYVYGSSSTAWVLWVGIGLVAVFGGSAVYLGFRSRSKRKNTAKVKGKFRSRGSR